MEQTQCTKIIFEVLDFKKENSNPLVNELKLSIANISVNISDSHIDIPIINFPQNINDYYIEKIELRLENKIQRYFRLKIYKNRINYRSIFLNELHNYAFEIGYFDTNSEKLPKTLNVKIKDKTYNLNPICKTDLPFVTTFGIINCDKAIMINDNQEIYLEDDKKGSFNINFIASHDNYIMNIIKIHKDYYPILSFSKYKSLNKKFKLIIDQVKLLLNNDKIKKSDFSIIIDDNFKNFWNNFDKYIQDVNYFITNKIYTLNEEEYSLLLNYIIYRIIEKANKHTETYPILKCFFELLDKLKIKEENHIINKRDIISFVYYFYEHYCSAEKYKKCLCNKIDSYKDLYENYSNKTIEWLDFEIVFIKECRKDCSYHKAVKLLKDVLGNLKSDSKLLEILYFIDSGTGRIRKNNKNDDSKISFNLSMISKQNIIDHVENLIPNIIIRKAKSSNKKTESYAKCDILSGIMTIYEETLFKKNFSETKKILIDEPDNEDKYTISIYLCLLHELFSHLKLLIKEKGVKSPTIINDPHYNYEQLKLIKGESGRTMEYYISKDIDKIKFLKFSFSPKKDLNNLDLWTDENFEKLNIKIDYLKNKNKSEEYLDYKLSYFPSKQDKDELKENNEDEIDWDISSFKFSDEEDPIENKSDVKNKLLKEEEEFEKFENYPDFRDIKPIVKY